VLLGTLLSTITGVLGRLRGEVEAHVTALELGTILGIVRLLGSIRVGEVNISEAAGAASLPVGDDTSAHKVVEALELLVQDVVINAPAEVTNPESGGRATLLGLGLLRSGLSLL
jgi:hypothetical protein